VEYYHLLERAYVPHPLFRDFIDASIMNSLKKKNKVKAGKK